MVINENNEQTLIEAKNEYYRQLTNIIRPHLYEGLQSLYNNAVDENKYDTQLVARTDMFTCGKCKSKRCTYYTMQTRSADEPETIFITCLDCGKNWKR